MASERKAGETSPRSRAASWWVDGLTATDAERELRRLIDSVTPPVAAGDRLILSAAGERYRSHVAAQGRLRGHILSEPEAT